ncbi:NAD(P)/FAD-dependent oxidoreductase [Desulfofundulus thermosubterraneus]|uniref:Pyridine nucleotide-disulphide oxidoreductase n=1 Tax=Desulfofundulus thermosubterraneus DSM 16057 TaxID=1121432 RepID=A0A1M6JL04_9FIRM|nr:FAD-dependent oxidoreductase [Desulfofundulus thermosubterraneus]SHJ47314.1 Pyridine nucleotide-disulphide oxidoreductase [Desulfofundulus thermosubterraneus DSM 16057]
MERFDYLIIGNSVGAVGCIETLRSFDKGSSIAVIGEEPHHVYSRALLPYYLDNEVPVEKMLYRPVDFYERLGVTPVLGRRAVGLDTAGHVVKLDDGRTISYGKLLLATGGRPIVPPIPGLDTEKENISNFVALQDLQRISRLLPLARRAVVLGGGIIGLMAAEALHKKGLEVSVVELAPRVLAPVVDEFTSRLIEEAFRRSAVAIYTGTTFKEVQGGERATGVVLTDGTSLPCDLLVVAVGVVPRVDLAREAGLAVNRGILVNQQMETSAAGVYACGDCAEVYDFLMGNRRVLPLWPNAYAGGRVAAYNMLGMKREYDRATSMNAMHFFDLNIITAGLNTAGEKDGFEVISRFDASSRSYRRFVLKDDRIHGFTLVTGIARAGIFLHLMRRGCPVTSFKEKLLEGEFGYLTIPEGLRRELLIDEGVMSEHAVANQ